ATLDAGRAEPVASSSVAPATATARTRCVTDPLAAAESPTIATPSVRYQQCPASRALRQPGLRNGHAVADGDRPVREDVGVDPGPVGELLDDPRARHRLQVQAGLAELDAVALDLADEEPPADEVVQPDAADGHLPARAA